ncbi:MAG: penicillin-insensitive murein endopeptidase [Solirubrobacterales bacterium]
MSTNQGAGRRRGVRLVVIVLVAGGLAAAAGGMLGAQEPGAAEERGVSVTTPTPVGDAREAPDREPPARESRDRSTAAPDSDKPRIEWRSSQAVGLPHAGNLERGVKLPFGGVNYFTWDPIQKESPNRGWRRWGTDRLVRTTLQVVRDFAAAHPRAPRIGIGDLSRPRGGDFGPRYGLPGHASHQNGLDVDLYYPRLDRRERAPLGPDQLDHSLSQDLVDRFVRAGAESVFVGPNTDLGGPPGVVVPLVNHDNHLHVRLPG